MHISRLYTREGQDAFAGLKFAPRTSRIVNPNGSVVFEMKDVHGPGGVVAGRGGHPRAEVLPPGRRAERRRARRRGRACPSGCSGNVPAAEAPHRRRDRLAGRCSAAWPAAGRTGAGRAATSRSRRTPGRSTTKSATCWRRRWRPRTARSGSTPGCTGPTASRARRRGTTTSTRSTARWSGRTSAYERPAPHACFIQSVNDDLVNDGGIMDLWVREARIFKYGIGTG